jgi:signal transduction histidine kinase
MPREGIFARVVTGGLVRAGDRIRLLALLLLIGLLVPAAGRADMPLPPEGGVRYPYTWLLLGMIAGAAIVLLGRRMRRAGTVRAETETSHRRQELLTHLATFGDSGICALNLQRLIQSGETAGTAGADPARNGERLAAPLRACREQTQGLLERIAVLSSQLLGWEAVAGLRDDIQSLDDRVREAMDGADSGPAAEALRAAAAASYKVLDRVRRLRANILAGCRLDLPAAVCRTVAAAQGRILAAGVERLKFELAPCPAASVDEQTLQTCLEIALDHAAGSCVKRAPGTITVSLEPAAGEIRLHVADTGPAIPPAEWERLFERNGGTRKAEGGPGLPGCRQDLARFDGRIQVSSSSAEEGTVLTMRFRAAP